MFYYFNSYFMGMYDENHGLQSQTPTWKWLNTYCEWRISFPTSDICKYLNLYWWEQNFIGPLLNMQIESFSIWKKKTPPQLHVWQEAANTGWTHRYFYRLLSHIALFICLFCLIGLLFVYLGFWFCYLWVWSCVCFAPVCLRKWGTKNVEFGE